ncbi:MAG: response regulator [Pseudomonadales bacterium]|nr:response regulator [Pseudomonadales bacterium]
MKKIQIIEDNLANQVLLDKILSANGYETSAANSGEGGVKLAQSNLPDLILMDLQMPVVDGYKALIMLRQDKKTRHIPVIVITGNAMHHDKQSIKAAGFDAYIFKPYKIDELLQTVSKTLSRFND